MEGDLLASYGQEDLCWTNNAAGNPEFTEYMYNNPDDLSLAEAYHYYAASLSVFQVVIASRSL